MNVMALDHPLQVREYLGKGPFQLVVIHQGVGVVQLSAWRARGGENETVLHTGLRIRNSPCLSVPTHQSSRIL